MLTRRTLLATLAALGCLPAAAGHASSSVFYRKPGCGCCLAWAERMSAAGLPVTMEDSNDLAGIFADYGIPEGLEGCHAGEIEGYAISGHVPPEDIKRLIAEKPDARGLLVPDMPAGSPGMEMGDQVDRYDVLLLARDGSTTVFASHG